MDVALWIIAIALTILAIPTAIGVAAALLLLLCLIIWGLCKLVYAIMDALWRWIT